MFYELKNGTLISRGDTSGPYLLNLDTKYTKQLDENHLLIIDSIQNKCYISSKDLLENGVNQTIFHELTDTKPCQDRIKQDICDNRVTFILAITYKCNMHCTYCYQQNNPNLIKHLISEDNLNKILHAIDEYMRRHPEKLVELGLFGGEPLLVKMKKSLIKFSSFVKSMEYGCTLSQMALI